MELNLPTSAAIRDRPNEVVRVFQTEAPRFVPGGDPGVSGRSISYQWVVSLVALRCLIRWHAKHNIETFLPNDSLGDKYFCADRRLSRSAECVGVQQEQGSYENRRIKSVESIKLSEPKDFCMDRVGGGRPLLQPSTPARSS
jgi:hypothetical protein